MTGRGGYYDDDDKYDDDIYHEDDDIENEDDYEDEDESDDRLPPSSSRSNPYSRPGGIGNTGGTGGASGTGSLPGRDRAGSPFTSGGLGSRLPPAAPASGGNRDDLSSRLGRATSSGQGGTSGGTTGGSSGSGQGGASSGSSGGAGGFYNRDRMGGAGSPGSSGSSGSGTGSSSGGSSPLGGERRVFGNPLSGTSGSGSSSGGSAGSGSGSGSGSSGGTGSLGQRPFSTGLGSNAPKPGSGVLGGGTTSGGSKPGTGPLSGGSSSGGSKPGTGPLSGSSGGSKPGTGPLSGGSSSSAPKADDKKDDKPADNKPKDEKKDDKKDDKPAASGGIAGRFGSLAGGITGRFGGAAPASDKDDKKEAPKADKKDEKKDDKKDDKPAASGGLAGRFGGLTGGITSGIQSRIGGGDKSTAPAADAGKSGDNKPQDDKKDDKKDDKPAASGGLAGRFGSLAGGITNRIGTASSSPAPAPANVNKPKDDKKDDKPAAAGSSTTAAPTPAAPSGPLGGVASGVGGLANRFRPGGGTPPPAATSSPAPSSGSTGSTSGGATSSPTARPTIGGGSPIGGAPTQAQSAAAPASGSSIAGPRFGAAGGKAPAPASPSPPAAGGKAAAPAASSAAPAAPASPAGSFLSGITKRLPFGIAAPADDKKAAPKTSKTRAAKVPTTATEGMSLDTKLDILGVALVFGALLLFLSALSPQPGAFTGAINAALSKTLGWGANAVPMAMMAAGVWLILRHFGDEAPVIQPLRVVGVTVFYAALLIGFQFIESFNALYAGDYKTYKILSQELTINRGRGGGSVGWALYSFLVENATEIGAVVIMLGLFVVAIMLITDTSAAELAMIVTSIVRSFQTSMERRAQARQARELAAQQAAPLPPPMPVATPVTVARPAAPELAPPIPASAALPPPKPELPLPEPVTLPIEERPITIRMGGQTLSGTEPTPMPATLPAASVPVPVPVPSPLTPATTVPSTPAAAAPAAKADEAAGNGVGSRLRGFTGGIFGRGNTPANAGDGKSEGKPEENTAAKPVVPPLTRPATIASPFAPPSTGGTKPEVPGTAQPAAASAGTPPARTFNPFARPAPQSAPTPPTPSATPATTSTPAVAPEDMLKPAAVAPSGTGVSTPTPVVGTPSPSTPTTGSPATSTPATGMPATGTPPADTPAASAPANVTPMPTPAASPAIDTDAEAKPATASTAAAFAGRMDRLNQLRSGDLSRPAAPLGRANPPKLDDLDDEDEDENDEDAPMTAAKPTVPGAASSTPAPSRFGGLGQPARPFGTPAAGTTPPATTSTTPSSSPFARPTPTAPSPATPPAASPIPAPATPAAAQPPVVSAKPVTPVTASPETPTPAMKVTLPQAPSITGEPVPPAPVGVAAPTVTASTNKPRKSYNVPDYKTLLSPGAEQDFDRESLVKRARIIEETLNSFGAPGRVVEINTGPVITQFGVEPDYLNNRGKKSRVKVSAIAQLDKDLQLALGAKSIRIEAPVPGKGFVGIEVPNDQPAIVKQRDVMDSKEFMRVKSPLAIALGQSVDGAPVAADLTSMPHMLIAGTTGSGKSVCVNSIIASLLLRNTPERVKFIMVDPKRVELTGYNGIPHLIAPVVVELERIVGVLKWVTREMDERYKKFSNAGARNIEDYNRHLNPGDEIMPYIVVIIDELADLMMLAPEETERTITRIAALARATGIHLVIATQRPSVDVVTGLIKANFPCRVAFAVASSVDSRVILDQPGAERLLGRGDMLYMSGDSPAPQRLQGVFLSDAEINNMVRYWRSQALDDPSARPITALVMDDSPAETARPAAATAGRGTLQTQTTPAQPPRPSPQQAFWDDGRDDDDDDDTPNGSGNGNGEGEDEMFDEAVELVRRLGKASVSLLQRRLRIGYTRAARLIDIMEERGIVGPATEGSKPRDVLK